jgi:large subunit ribosomal protein L4
MDTQKNKKSEARFQAITMQDLGVVAPSKPVAREQFARWVRALLQNWRQGTVGVKGRSDVSLTNKKPWKQKGTGRARAGTARSPLWRGGGVTFGPQKRTRVLSVPKESKKRILHQLLVERLDNGNVMVFNWELQGDRPQTKVAAQFLKEMGLLDKKVTLFLSPNDALTYSSFANIPNVQVLLFDQPNAYDLVNCHYWIFLQKDLDAFKEVVRKWQ